MPAARLCFAPSKLPNSALLRLAPLLSQEKNIAHNGNLTIEDVYEVARVMADRSCAATFAGTVKEMLGTCVSGEPLPG